MEEGAQVRRQLLVLVEQEHGGSSPVGEPARLLANPVGLCGADPGGGTSVPVNVLMETRGVE